MSSSSTYSQIKQARQPCRGKKFSLSDKNSVKASFKLADPIPLSCYTIHTDNDANLLASHSSQRCDWAIWLTQNNNTENKFIFVELKTDGSKHDKAITQIAATILAFKTAFASQKSPFQTQSALIVSKRRIPGETGAQRCKDKFKTQHNALLKFMGVGHTCDITWTDIQIK